MNNTTKMSDEQGRSVSITGLRAALHIQRLISWMLILKWIPARAPRGTKAECDTVPATAPARILRAASVLATNANNSWGNSAPSNMQVQTLPPEVLWFERVCCSLWVGVGFNPDAASNG